MTGLSVTHPAPSNRLLFSSMTAITWPMKTGTTSAGMKDPKNWRDEAILIPHEGLRWLDRQLLAMIDKFDPHAQPSTAWMASVPYPCPQ